ncbi:hypothetical protein EVJ58_g7485 [Rhodofomes roseus]|uniref:DUF6534 domain-containing protein n=1 Tax=Rhodofomes roseus TaxID=34475 RepID=A0A4Y9Y3K3_9APHY|nr:hypothetical protein EVJ58_g7485 [Rhodofomes roseus]
MIKVAGKIPATINSVCAFVADIYITICLCVAMHSKATGVKRTNNVIYKLIIYSINRGILTVLVQMLVFVQYGSADDNLISDAFHIVAPAFYVNTTMAV